MKGIQKFIETKLGHLVQEFDSIRASYSYDGNCETYYVKVIPATSFLNSELLTEKRSDILDEFLDEYPDDSIVFLTEGSLIQMGTIIETFSGKSFYKYINGLVHHIEFDTLETVLVSINYTSVKSDAIEIISSETDLNIYSLAA